MPNISELKESRFVTKGDLGPQGSLFTVTGCEQVNVAPEGAQPEMKWALTFKEIDKPFIINSTNGQIIAGFTGTDEMGNWTERQIVLYFDPNVSFAGKLTGGIRARAPKIAAKVAGSPIGGARPAPAPAPRAEEAPSEDVPF